MTAQLEPLFFSGPHGGGKTTLIEALLAADNRCAPLTFEINFLRQFTTFKQLAHWERCLVRLYHRMYTAHIASLPQASDADDAAVVLVSRGLVDSAAYVEAYAELGWISPEEHRTLRVILDNHALPRKTVLLLPPVETVLARLEHRRLEQTRSDRDAFFTHEDSDEFVSLLWHKFADMADRSDVLVVEDNDEAAQEEVLRFAGLPVRSSASAAR